MHRTFFRGWEFSQYIHLRMIDNHRTKILKIFSSNYRELKRETSQLDTNTRRLNMRFEINLQVGILDIASWNEQ